MKEIKNKLKNMLIIANNKEEIEKVVENDKMLKDIHVDYVANDIQYDLVVYVNFMFRMSLKYPMCIADAEIWFERGDKMSKAVLDRVLDHFYTCEIRKGK